MTEQGRTLLKLVLILVTVLLLVFGTGLAAFATGVVGGLPWFLLGVGMLVAAGAALAVVLRPVPSASLPRWQLAGRILLGVSALSMLSALGLPLSRVGPLQVVFSPWGLAASVVLGVGLVIAARDRPAAVDPASPPVPPDWRDPRPG